MRAAEQARRRVSIWRTTRTSLLLCQLAGEAGDPPPRLFEARLGGGQRDAQVTDGTRPEAVARQQNDVLAEQQFPRKILRAEPAAADVEQHEHAAFGRDRATVRSVRENVRQQQGTTAIGVAQSADFGELGGECGQSAVLDERGAAEIQAEQKIEQM